MLESLQLLITDIEAAWANEIEDRVYAFDQGEISAHCAEEVCGEARQSLR
jgi:hypothetical protein